MEFNSFGPALGRLGSDSSRGGPSRSRGAEPPLAPLTLTTGLASVSRATCCVQLRNWPSAAPATPGAQNGKGGGPKWPELCIKTVIRLCTGISQNRHPCLLTLPFRTGRYLLFRNLGLFLILRFRSYSDVIGLSELSTVTV